MPLSANTGLLQVISSRDGLKDYVKRQLGEPVIRVEIDDNQLEDAIDNALLYFQDYHVDATERIYLKYQMQQADIDNQYIPLPPGIIGIVKILPLTDGNSTVNMFDIRYQIRLNDLYDFSTTSVTNYWMTMTHIRLLDMLFNGESQVRYNRHNNQLHIDWDWSDSALGMSLVGQYLIIECFQVVDPDVFTDTWNDRWLRDYSTALAKKQWGTNLKKFAGVSLPGGITLNGKEIYDEAMGEISELRTYLTEALQSPPEFLVG